MVTISPQLAAHVLHHFGSMAVRPGSGTRSLLDAIARMDPSRRARARLAFPEEVLAMELAMGHDNGIATLQGIAGLYATDVAGETVSDLARDIETLSATIRRCPLDEEARDDICGFLDAAAELTRVAVALNQEEK